MPDENVVITVTVDRNGQTCSNTANSTPRTYTSVSTFITNDTTSTSIFSTVFPYAPLSSSYVPLASASTSPPLSLSTSSSISATPAATFAPFTSQSKYHCSNDVCKHASPEQNGPCLSASDNSTLYAITCGVSVEGLAAFTPSIPRALHEKRSWAETLTDCLGRCDKSEACDAVTYYSQNCVVYDSVVGWADGAEGSLSAVKMANCDAKGGCPGRKGGSSSIAMPRFSYVPTPSIRVPLRDLVNSGIE
ncbi:hypothetical protein K431DRAFT_289493 [Polychaeton citri CBS 116435]|uniref:Apple domain-containing protein n=1 Tax=Polychaeton citri CBS 116435 TaxID=1314669 RepID=A0A9P4Q1J0_9PEZI|nr:hypothetical protein K431DRAFT_289493 [Polychaeton citri CBS 116435]